MEHIQKTFTKYVLLNVLGLIGLSCYILADTFFIARGIGQDGLAALNLAIPVYSVIHGSGLMIGMGGAIRYSISKDKNVFTQAFYFVLLLSAIFVLCGIIFPDRLALLLGANHATLDMTSIYLKVVLCFAPMFLLNNLLICFVRNDGNPKLSMAAMIMGSLSNIVLDYVFVFPLQMGMFGAVLATGIAPIISILVISSHFIKKKNTFHLTKDKPTFKRFAGLSALGLSSLITELSSGIVILIFNKLLLNLTGNIGVAAYGIIANIALVAMAILTGISQGMQPIVSKSMGSGKTGDAKKVLKYGVITALLFSVLLYTVIFIFTEPLVSVFNKEQNQQLAEIAIRGMQIYFTAFFFAGINIMIATYFTSCGKPGNAFAISFSRGFLVIIPAAIVLSLHFGTTGIWLAMAVTEFLVLFFSISLGKIRGIFK